MLTAWVCRVGVVQVNSPESSWLACRMLRRYSSAESRPSSEFQPVGYTLRTAPPQHATQVSRAE